VDGIDGTVLDDPYLYLYFYLYLFLTLFIPTLVSALCINLFLSVNFLLKPMVEVYQPRSCASRLFDINQALHTCDSNEASMLTFCISAWHRGHRPRRSLLVPILAPMLGFFLLHKLVPIRKFLTETDGRGLSTSIVCL